MRSCLSKNKGYYISLTAVLFLGGLFAFSANFDKTFALSIVSLITLFYVGFGILHHHLHHDISAKVVVEYVLVGSLSMALVLLVLKGGILS